VTGRDCPKIKSFDDAFLALQAVEESGYKTAEITYPHNGKYRFSGFPKDAFYISFPGEKLAPITFTGLPSCVAGKTTSSGFQ
jgi:hypothetical protein